MKLGPVTKLTRETRQRQKKIDDGVISTNYGGIDIFPIYGRFGLNCNHGHNNMRFFDV